MNSLSKETKVLIKEVFRENDVPKVKDERIFNRLMTATTGSTLAPPGPAPPTKTKASVYAVPTRRQKSQIAKMGFYERDDIRNFKIKDKYIGTEDKNEFIAKMSGSPSVESPMNQQLQPTVVNRFEEVSREIHDRINFLEEMKKLKSLKKNHENIIKQEISDLLEELRDRENS